MVRKLLLLGALCVLIVGTQSKDCTCYKKPCDGKFCQEDLINGIRRIDEIECVTCVESVGNGSSLVDFCSVDATHEVFIIIQFEK